MKPPAVLFLLDWQPFFWSTREEFFLRLSRETAARGAVPLLTISEAADPRILERFESAGARVSLCPYQPAAYWRHIGGICAAYDVRLVQVRFFQYFSLVPWMCRLHGIRDIVFTEANSGEWRPSGWKAALVRLRTRLVCAPMTRVVAVSEFIRSRLIDCGIPESKTIVIYNGVDTGAFPSVDPPPDEIHIAFASSLLAWKRPQIALRVAAELVRRGRKVHMSVMGTGPLRAALEAEGRETGATIDWLGHHPHPPQVIAAAHVFLHTAVGEAFGNVLAEAMACGTPIVASKSGATPEIIDHGVTGFLAPVGPDEISALADAVEQAMANKSMRGAGIETARRRFSVDKAVAATIALYDELGAFPHG